MPKLMTPQEQPMSIHFPAAGIDRAMALGRQPNRQVLGQYRRTCVDAVNVRAIDLATGRARGCSRSGLTRQLQPAVSGEKFVIQDLSSFARVEGVPQVGSSGRVVTIVAVSEGRIFSANAGDTTWTEATNNTGETPPLAFSGVLFSSANQQKLWFVDRVNAVVFSPATNTVSPWTATAGQFPVDADGNLPRIVETWRGRMLLSGLLKDPQNIFASRVDGPTDFDYAPVSPSALDAWALNIPDGLGLIGDVVTGIIPYNDDLVIIGCDSSMRLIRGDPTAAGQTDTISHEMGMAWGRAWARDDKGNTFFFSNNCRVYVLPPGGMPQPISQGIDNLLKDVNTGDNIIRLLWDNQQQCLEVFITPLDAPALATHFTWEYRTAAWFKREFANNDHNPLCCCTFDGNEARDRVPLLGCWDGVVRAIDPAATTDDGVRIDSSVLIGPIVSKDFGVLTIRDILPTFATDSNEVLYDILTGESPEAALASTPKESGIWQPGRGLSTFANWAAHATYIRVKSKPTMPNPWAMESLGISVRDRERIRRRQQ